MNFNILEELLNQFTPLVHKVLIEHGQKRNHKDYEDYYQELCIKLVEIAQEYEGDPLGDDRYRFTYYAKKGLSWHLIDLLKKDRHNEYEQSLSDFIFESEGVEASKENITAFMTEMVHRVTESELQLIKAFLDGNTLQEIAKQFKVSRKTISKRKKHIQEKLSDLKSFLEGD